MSSKINDLQAHICKLSYPQKKVLKFLMGGRGWSLSVKIVGASYSLKKRKWKKGRSPTPHYKKKKTINPQFAIVHPYHAHNAKDNREDRANGQHPR
jgi:hypothetical protein